MEYLLLFSSSQVSLAHQPQYIGRSFRFHSLSMLEYVYIWIYIYIYLCMYKINYFKESWRYRVT